MQQNPSAGVKHQSQIETRWNSEAVMIDQRAQIIEAEPGEYTDGDIADDASAGMYSGLFQKREY